MQIQSQEAPNPQVSAMSQTDFRDREQSQDITAGTERGSHRGQGGLAVDGTLANLNDERAIVLTADAGRADARPADQ
jgi:hypothetical protein